MNLLRLSSTRSQRGNVLGVTLMFGAIVGVVLLGCLKLIQTRSLTTMRSLAWNSAIPVLEAGIEEAFTHLRKDSTLMTANGWTSVVTNGNTVYQKRRDLPGGSYCLVTISNASTYPITAPVIFSQGFVPAPLGNGYISRKVQVNATNPPAFSKAIAAKSIVTMSGGAVVDSFDSSNTNYSSNGYYDPAKRKPNGSVVTNSKANGAIDVGTAHVYGLVDTGPGGTVTTGGGGTVGDFDWSAVNTGIETNYVSSDMNVAYADQAAPTNSLLWLPPLPGIYPYNGTNYSYRLGTDNYKVGSFAMNGGQTMVVTGNAILYVTDDINISGNSYIFIAPGGSFQLIVGAGTATLSGGGVINGTGAAANFSYRGLPTNTKLDYSGGSAFVGTVNAPQAAFKLSGGSGMFGACILDTFTSSGGASVHYDEGLATPGLLTLTGYREL